MIVNSLNDQFWDELEIFSLAQAMENISYNVYAASSDTFFFIKSIE